MNLKYILLLSCRTDRKVKRLKKQNNNLLMSIMKINESSGRLITRVSINGAISEVVTVYIRYHYLEHLFIKFKSIM